MSQSTVKSFLDFAKTSEDIRTKLEKGMPSSSIVNTASEKGYNFNEQELSEYLTSNNLSQELNTEELELVAGGKPEISITITIKF
jgi:predicted ribosomally synthesized peptide with nif11-like leader